MSRFLGRSGEKRFSLLCSEAGVTCNPSTEDDHGWDHVVQFPFQHSRCVPADMQHRLPAVFVQTKSHEADGLKVTMKLSNAVSLAKSINPCFVVLATLPDDGKPGSWHAVHVWGKLLERILKRARTESSKGVDASDFHKKDFSFTMTASDAVEEANLVQWIERTVAGAGPDYAAAKLALVPPASMLVNVDFGPLRTLEEFVDHTIGLTESVPVHKVTLTQRRLGVDIPVPFPFEPDEGGSIMATIRSAPVRQANVRLRGPGGAIIEMAADVHIPPPNVPDDKVKCRFSNRNLEIVWDVAGGTTMNLSFDGSERMSPLELENVLRLGSWAGQSDIDIVVSVDDEAVLGATAKLHAGPDRDLHELLATVVEPLVRVSAHLKKRLPQISIDEVGSSEKIAAFHQFVSAKTMLANASVDKDSPVPEVTAGIALGTVEIGEWTFAAIQRFPIMAQKRDEDSWSLEFGAPILVGQHVFEADNEFSSKHVVEDYARLSSAPGVVALGDIMPALQTSEV